MTTPKQEKLLPPKKAKNKVIFCNMIQDSVSTRQIFFQPIKQLFVGRRTNHFGKMVNIALETLTNLWKYDIKYTLILDCYKI